MELRLQLFDLLDLFDITDATILERDNQFAGKIRRNQFSICQEIRDGFLAGGDIACPPACRNAFELGCDFFVPIACPDNKVQGYAWFSPAYLAMNSAKLSSLMFLFEKTSGDTLDNAPLD
jgi:hypothetical protein